MKNRQLNKKTILDIARLANASPATVSRVLNPTGYPVSQQMRERVLEAARELDYRPNIFSQMLKGAKSKEIGIIIPSLANPYYSLLASDVAGRCVQSDYAPIICSSFGDKKLEERQLEILLRQQVAGILYSSIQDEPERLIRERESELLPPVVMFDQDGLTDRVSSVVFDFEKAGELMGRYLIENGHREIVFASGALDRGSRRQVLKGYRSALEKAGLPLKKNMILESEPEDNQGSDFEKGNFLGEQILAMDHLPDAVFGINDITAIGIMNRLREKGVRVPEDISVTGLDDIEMASMTIPGLTTIRQPVGRTGEAAMKLLLDSIENDQAKPQKVMIEPRLIIRGSVKRRI